MVARKPRTAKQIAAQKKAAAASAKKRSATVEPKAAKRVATRKPNVTQKAVPQAGLKGRDSAAKAAGIKADQARRAKRRAKEGPAPVAKSAIMGITRGTYSGKSRAEVDKIYNEAGYRARS